MSWVQMGVDSRQHREAESAQAVFKGLAGIGDAAGTCEPEEVTESGWRNSAQVAVGV